MSRSFGKHNKAIGFGQMKLHDDHTCYQHLWASGCWKDIVRIRVVGGAPTCGVHANVNYVEKHPKRPSSIF